jgi:nickel/cobalt transporter (NicO) family protein
VGVLLTVLLGGLLLGSGAAQAHPLGNLSVNHASALRIGTDAVHVLFVADLAEVPSVPALADLAARGKADYGATRCADYAAGLELTVDGTRTPLAVDGSSVFTLAGEAGLSTLRLECRLSTSDSGARVEYADRTDADRAGWREVTAVGDGTSVVDSTVPERSRSNLLASYPTGDVERIDTADVTVRPGGAAAVEPAAGTRATPTDPLAGLLDGHGWAAALLAGLVAALLGAGHALTPGHGKTLMALYLSGTRGSLRDAVVVGASVTATHTLGVFLLAALVSASVLTAPDAVYPWLGVVHGALITVIGAVLLAVRWRRRDHDHGHDHGHGHGHRRAGRFGLVGFGVAGGLLPSPSALLVLLGAQAVGRQAYGIVLVLAYGLGMALCLSVVGWLLAKGGRFAAHPDRRGVLGWVGRRLPVLAPLVIVASGLVLTVRSVL